MPEEVQQFIALFTPCRPTFPADGTPEEFARVAEHFDELKADQENGALILAGRTMDENPAGIYIFKAANMDSALARIERDAAIRAGVFILQWLRPYSVALSSPP